MDMGRLKQLHQHIWDRVVLQNALEGERSPERAEQLRAQIEEKTCEIETLMAFINSFEPSLAHYALMAHCFWGLSWEEIAAMDGYRKMPGAYRKAAYRGLNEKQKAGSRAKNSQCGKQTVHLDEGGRMRDQ